MSRFTATARGTMLVATAILATGALAACGDDEDDPGGGTGDGIVTTTLDPGDGTATIPDLPDNDDPSAVTCTGPPEGTLDATKLVGLELEQASEEARAQGCSVREVIRDGEPLAVTEDFRPDRVNVATEDGVVTRIVSLG